MDLSQALEVWWVLPVSVCIATIALALGISGALFFSPFFLLVVGLEPSQAIGAGLITELFGTGVGAYNYVRQRVVDFMTVRFLLAASIPAAVAGAFIANQIRPGVLQVILGITLFVLAVIVIYYGTLKGKPPIPVAPDESRKMTIIKARDGDTYSYKTCRRYIGVTLSGIGGLLTGLVSVGLPEITTQQLTMRCHIPSRIAVATAIFVLTVTVFFAAGVHALEAEPAWYVVVWSIPGVIIGAQIGPRFAGRIPTRIAERVIATLFLTIGILVIVTQIID
ncbi:MAG: sulfite exporter TauE/SafE family protein [Dehalococcoidia bacterium]|nr:sulfite exporter TauE/SafE family protein [Dehalococcoidia bacterium]